MSVAARNWLCLSAAFVVNVLMTREAVPADHPIYLLLAEAVGYTFPMAIVPVLMIVRRRPKPPRVYHVWTLLVSIVLAFGRHYANTH